MKKTELRSTATCQICSSKRQLIRVKSVRRAVISFIEKEIESLDKDGWICLDDLHDFRCKHIHSLLEAERGELTQLDRDVVESIRKHETLTKNLDEDIEKDRTFGQFLADKIASFGGSWRFISIFLVMMIIWMGINVYVLVEKPFDPYPFILLNLVLSCLAAIQAPIIMMSQNRQESRDRLRATNDYQVNLKAELEIRHLHQKIDHLLSTQWEKLMEIQEIQIDLINDLRETPKK